MTRAASLIWHSARFHVVISTMLALVDALIPVAVAWLTKLALDKLVTPSPLGTLIAVAAGLAAVNTASSVTPHLGQYVRAELDRRVALRANDELFATVDGFGGLARFEDPDFLDRLRLAQQSATGPRDLLESILQAGSTVLTVMGFLTSLSLINPFFAAIIILAAIPALVIELRLSRQRAAMMWEIGPVQRRESFYAELLGTVHAAKEIRLLNLGAFLRARMNSERRTANAAQRRMDRRELLQQSVLALLAALVAGGGQIWSIATAGRGLLTVGDVAMFTTAVAATQAGMSNLVRVIAATHQHLQLFQHYMDVINAPPDIVCPEAPCELPPLRHRIELRDVWFRYSDAHPWVLRGVNLVIPRGQAVALIGRNGGGKSTLIKLLCRFYEPTRGQILWDGVDIRDCAPEQLRGRIGAVFQDFMSYDFSAADNIAVGDLSAMGDLERIRAAADYVGIHDHISSLPSGYETLLTRMFTGGDAQVGVLLSGGQWQRVAIARAFLRWERDLMILDEPSSGLDAIAEHELHSQLRGVRANRASLVISHRLSAIRHADQIAVLDEGVIAEVGTHCELVASGGIYAQLYKVQASGYQ